jgi:hypothetical protein
MANSARNDAFSFWKLPEPWRPALSDTIAPSEGFAERYLFEKYLDSDRRRPPAGMRAFRRAKGLIPTGMRRRINTIAARSHPRREFPGWPCESMLLDYWRKWLGDSLASIGVSDGWHLGWWPRGARCCIVLTHDVETPRGFERIEAMADVEEELGFRSAWNLPLVQYPIDWERVAGLRRRGFEFGVHGLRHDGASMRGDRDFLEMKPFLERFARERGLAGFRAPAILRRTDLIAAIPFDFDSSFSDTDPYEPQPGGTCSVFPFFLGSVVELPYTLAQDRTLIHMLRRNPAPLWDMKARWIASVGGMILTLTHPDCCGIEPHLSEYAELLRRLASIDGAWRALPSEVAAWWRRRNAIALKLDGNRPVIDDAGGADAVACRLSETPLAR